MAQKILLVEDDKFTRELYEEVLKDAGFEVSVAIDGEEGFNKACQGGFNLVLLDVMLPKMDGLELLRSLRNKEPQVKNGPIVLLTNLTHDPVIEMAKSLGIRDNLVKSDLDPGKLVELVKGYLAESEKETTN